MNSPKARVRWLQSGRKRQREVVEPCRLKASAEHKAPLSERRPKTAPSETAAI